MTEFDNGGLLSRRDNSEQNTVNQRFSEMNEKISELTIVLALTEKISSTNREGNGLQTIHNTHDTRSDTHGAKKHFRGIIEGVCRTSFAE